MCRTNLAPISLRPIRGGKLWVREVRKLTETSHQTAILSTDHKSAAAVLAPAMFARWSQENFFRYMRQSHNLDGLVDYGTGNVPDTIPIGPPDYCRPSPSVWRP